MKIKIEINVPSFDVDEIYDALDDTKASTMDQVYDMIATENHHERRRVLVIPRTGKANCTVSIN